MYTPVGPVVNGFTALPEMSVTGLPSGPVSVSTAPAIPVPGPSFWMPSWFLSHHTVSPTETAWISPLPVPPASRYTSVWVVEISWCVSHEVLAVLEIWPLYPEVTLTSYTRRHQPPLASFGALNVNEFEPLGVTVYSFAAAVCQIGHVPTEFNLVACSKENVDPTKVWLPPRVSSTTTLL